MSTEAVVLSFYDLPSLPFATMPESIPIPQPEALTRTHIN